MNKYVIDASSLNELEDRYPKNISVFRPIYDKIERMFENGSLFSVREVFEELKDSQEFWKDYEYCFRELTQKESENVSTILDEDKFETFVIKGLNENDGHWADPHLIACAMEDDSITVITEESRTNKKESKIPYVCAQLGIRSIKLLEFLSEIE